MKLLLEIKDSEASFLIKLLNFLPFVKKVEEVKPRAATDLRQGLKRIKLIEEGEINLKGTKKKNK